MFTERTGHEETIHLLSLFVTTRMVYQLHGAEPFSIGCQFCRRFIALFTRALHWSLSWARPLHSVSPRSILILSAYLRLGLLSGLFLSGFPPNIYSFLFSLIRATFPTKFILLDLGILYCILASCYIRLTLNICSFVRQCNTCVTLTDKRTNIQCWSF
jgi:hypothetical protein